MTIQAGDSDAGKPRIGGGGFYPPMDIARLGHGAEGTGGNGVRDYSDLTGPVRSKPMVS